MFRNPNQRKFLFALDRDRTKGINPGTGQIPGGPVSGAALAPVMHQPSSMNAPMIHSPSMSLPHQNNFHQQSMSPTAVPSLPALGKLPKFGKIKNSLKGQFKK